jgi:hypothetical protein
MRNLLIALSILAFSAAPAHSQVSVGFTAPGLSIGINVPVYPPLVPVPGYPVYYAPGLNLNYFFYDGLFWVYQADNWYASSWYNGPWQVVRPFDVPAYVLRIPIRYYRQPPVYFRGWRADAPPRWDEHWGRDWQQRRGDWQHQRRQAAPPPAPLPSYQRNYPANRYPGVVQQQHAIRSQNYPYQPREPVARQHFQPQNQPGPIPHGGPDH